MSRWYCLKGLDQPLKREQTMRSSRRVAWVISIALLAIKLLPGSRAFGQSESGVVHAIMFWMEGCGHCNWVKTNTLPPLAARYGDQWQLELIELRNAEDFDRLFALGAAVGLPREAIGVPDQQEGDAVLIGSDQIPAELPGLIEEYRAAGGVGWPSYPGLDDLLPEGVKPPSSPGAAADTAAPGPVIEAILFSTLDCNDCQLIIAQALVPLREQYGDALQVKGVDIVTSEDVNYLYQMAVEFDLSQEQVDLPMLIIGKQVLIGEQIPAELPGLMEQHLNDGGVNAPVLPVRHDAAPVPAAVLASIGARSDGFALAVVVMIGMIMALLFAIERSIYSLKRPSWPKAKRWDVGWLIPLLAVMGLGVAVYLAYVETQAVAAGCGPVGDCNAVQTSEYAYLFGIPIGVLGVIGYVAILVTWAWGAWRADNRATLALLAITAFGVLFSIYLTYLEPFVISGVCAWCLTSAVVMTLLLLLSVEMALPQLAKVRDDD